MIILRKYNTATHIYIPIIKRGVVDFSVGADWTPVAGDVKISKDGGAAANVTNLPTAIAMGNTAMWDFNLTATELQAAKIMITVADAVTKTVEDQCIAIETYGNASAQHAVDLSDSVRMGLTALPNAAAGANGGLPLGDASARVDIGKWLGTAPNALVQGKLDAATIVRSGTAQAGAASSITLDAGASAIADFYKGLAALIAAGTGAGQMREITAYNGTTKVASVAPNLATNPDGTSVFILIPIDGVVVGADAKAILSSDPHTGAVVPTVTSVTNDVKISSAFKKNAAYVNYMFLMVDDTDGKTPETGLTGISCTRSIDGAAFGACANSASEVGNGWYKIDLAAGDLNGDEIVLRFTKSGVARNWEHKIRTNP